MRIEAQSQRLGRIARFRKHLLAVDYAGNARFDQRVVVTAYLLWRGIVESSLMSKAAALAFTFLLALVPMLTTTMAFFTALPGLAEDRQKLLGFLFDQLLPSAVESVQRYLIDFRERAAAAGAVSSLAFLVIAALFLQSLEQTINRVWRAENDRTWGKRLQGIAAFFLTGAIAATALTAVDRGLRQIAERSQSSLATNPWLRSFLAEALSLCVAWLAFSVVNKLLPSTKVRWRAALVAGVTFGTLWHFLKDGFTLYVASFANYENVYGVLGVVPAFFIWVQLTLGLLIASAHLAFIHQNLNALVIERRVDGTGYSKVYYALAVAGTLADAFTAGLAPLSAPEIARRLGIALHFVAEALPPLFAVGSLLKTSDTKGEPCYSLAQPAQLTSLSDIVAQVTREPFVPPEDSSESPLSQRIEALLERARTSEGNAFAGLTLADLASESRPPIRERHVRPN